MLRNSGINGYGAFQTDKGMEKFLKITNTKMIPIGEEGLNQYVLSKQIQEILFWNLNDIHNFEKCTAFVGLSNGSLVTCYAYNDDKQVIIWRPNPNAKNVYKPLSIEEHIKYNREFG